MCIRMCIIVVQKEERDKKIGTKPPLPPMTTWRWTKGKERTSHVM